MKTGIGKKYILVRYVLVILSQLIPNPDNKYIVMAINRYSNTYYGESLTSSANSKHSFYLGPPFWFFKLIEENQ